MDLPTIIAALFIVILGFFISKDDIRMGKIRNKYVLLAILLGFIVQFIAIFPLENQLRLFGMWIFQFIGAFILGVLIWVLGLWSPGDAKLFAAFFSILPVTMLFSTSLIQIHLLINATVPVFAYLLIIGLLKSNKQKLKFMFQNSFSPRRIAMYLLMIFSLGWIVNLLLGLLRNNNLISIPETVLTTTVGIMLLGQLITYIANYPVLKKSGINEIKILIAISILHVLLNFEQILLLEFWKNFILITVAYGILFTFVSSVSVLFTKAIPVKDLKKGMFLAEMPVIKGKLSNIIPLFSTNQKFPGKPLFKPKNEGLSSADINKLKKMHIRDLHIHQTIPFAPFIVIAALLTLFLKTNIVSLIISFF